MVDGKLLLKILTPTSPVELTTIALESALNITKNYFSYKVGFFNLKSKQIFHQMLLTIFFKLKVSHY